MQGLQADKDVKETELLQLQGVREAAKSKFNMARSEHDLFLSNQTSETNKMKETERNLETTVSTLKERHK